jgi:hypothetical protein
MAGCAGRQPLTFNQELAMGYVTIAGIRDSTAMLLDERKINDTDAAHVQASCDIARSGFNVARLLSQSDQLAAQAKLNATVSALRALQQYLADLKGPP